VTEFLIRPPIERSAGMLEGQPVFTRMFGPV
jgi:hypothetical protein